jgi:alginate O-acetyltransferase complex protein AlgJ
MRSRRFSDWCLCGLFVTMLGWGGIASLWNIWLNRAELPLLAEAGWTWFPTKFESFFNDHLAARERMTAILGRVKMRCLKSSPTPRVWVGRDEWLFYNHNADPIYHGRIDFEVPALVDYWARELSARRKHVEALGAKYLVVIAPNKQSVHPEFLLTANWEPGRTTLDRVLERCLRDPQLSILDLRVPLREAKAEQPVYLRFDSHWNHIGAYAAYASIVARLGEWDRRLQPYPFSYFVPHFDHMEKGDLARLVGLGDRLTDELTAIAISITRSRLTKEQVPRNANSLQHVSSFVSVLEGEDLPRAVLLTDSFGEYPAMWLREHFSRLVTVGTYALELGLIDRERPDFVIQLIIERQLDGRKSFSIDPSEFRRY